LKYFCLLSITLATLLIQTSCKDFWHPEGPMPKPVKPVVEVYFNDDLILQNGIIDARSEIITHSKDIIIVIKNTGTDVLTIDTANITITGEDEAAFTIATFPISSIPKNDETSLRITCEPVKENENIAILTIPTNDNLCNPIILNLRIIGEKGYAVLELSQAGEVIRNNSLTPVDFNQVELGTIKSLTFTIKNTGKITLELTGTPLVKSSNTAFTIPTQPVDKIINPGADVSFIIQYNPTVEAEENGIISINNNSDVKVFIFNLKGTGYVKRPRILIKQGTSPINPNGEYDFGTVAIDETKDTIFSIENIGDSNLNIISVNGSRVNFEDDADEEFSVIQQPSSVVIIGNSTNFSLRFKPMTEENNFTATVHIKSNSQDNDDFYFVVKGSSYMKRPQISIKQGTVTINPNGEYNFNSILFDTTKDAIFTIGNSGEADLSFVSVNGNNVNLENNFENFFTIIQQPLATTIASGDTTSFTIRFNPTTIGNNYSATIIIKTNSQYNNEFSFAIRGNGRDLSIGDTGPGGGIIFFAQGGMYKECSAELGSYPWNEAIIAAQNHRGGGYSDWYLPDRGELQIIYSNLRSNGFGIGRFWSSSDANSEYAWSVYSGDQVSWRKFNSCRVYAVRVF